MEVATDLQALQAAPSSEAQAAMLAAHMFGGVPDPQQQQQQPPPQQPLPQPGQMFSSMDYTQVQPGAQPQVPMMFPGVGGTTMGMGMGTSMGVDMNAVGMAGMPSMEGVDPSQTTVSGEVRYDDPAHAQQALNMLDGSLLYGQQITVRMSTTNNPTGTKLVVTGIPQGCGWQELKDHFKNVGTVAFAGLAGDKGKGRGKATDSVAPQMGGMKRGFDGGPMGMAKYTRGVSSGMGVVRFQDPVGAQMSLQILGGTELKGSAIKVDYDTSVGDGTQVLVTGLSDVVTPQDLIEYFSTAGPVATAEVKKSSPASGGNEIPDQSIGEIRYDNPEHSGIAVASLNGSLLQGCTITVIQDPTAPDGNKLQVLGLSPMTQWQELKDHFGQVGPVAYAGVRGGKPEFTTAQFEGMMIPYQGAAMPMQPQPQMAYGTGTACALVRFGTAEEANKAVAQLNGMDMQEQGGTTLSVTLDGGSKDGTKIRMRGLPPTTQWQDLKDFCGQLGTIAFCEVAPDNGITATGEIRYANPEHALVALSTLNGSTIDGAIISVTQDLSSQSGSKLLVMGLSPLTQWQELKDHFGQIGHVAYAGIVGDKGRGRNRMERVAAAAQGGCQQYPPGGPTFNMGAASPPMGMPMGQMGQPMGMGGQPMGQPMMPAMGQPQGGCCYGGGYPPQQAGGAYYVPQQRPPRQRRNAPPSIEGRTALAGEVRFEDPAHAQMALNTLNGTEIGGAQIQVQPHKFNNPMGTKILVTGLPLHVGWQELKEHFMQCGHVAFAATR